MRIEFGGSVCRLLLSAYRYAYDHRVGCQSGATKGTNMNDTALLAKIEELTARRDRFSSLAMATLSADRDRATRLAAAMSEELVQLHSERIARGLEIPANA